MTYGFRKCDTGGIPRLKLGADNRLAQCCPRGWFAGVFMACLDPYNETHDLPGDYFPEVRSKQLSIRSDDPDGTIITTALDVSFFAEDPDDPYIDEDNPGGTILIESTLTIDLTVGTNTSGAFSYYGVVSGGTVDYEGSEGTPATTDNPEIHVWINSFGAPWDKQYRVPLEYAVPLCIASDPTAVGFLTFLYDIGYPVQWYEAAEAARAVLTPSLDPITDPGVGAYTQARAERFGAAYAMDAFYANYPFNPKGHSFIRPYFVGPTSKRTDEPFLIDLKLFSIYHGRFLAPGEALGTINDEAFVVIPETLLVNVTEGQRLYLPFPTYDPGMFIGLTAFGGDYGYRYKYDGCYALAREGVHQIKSRQAVDPLSGGGTSIGIADFWWFYTAPFRVTRSDPYQYRLHQYDPADLRYYLPAQPVSGSIPQGDDGVNPPGPLEVRIVDFAGAQLGKEWNLCTEATNHVIASLVDLGGNAHASPSLDGTFEKDAVAGVAVFDALKVVGLGRNYELQFTCSPFDYDEANGPPLSNTPGETYHKASVSIACNLRINNPGGQAAGVAFDLVCDVIDADGNLMDPTTVDDLTLSGDAGVTGYGTQTPAGGTTTFSLTIAAPGTYQVKLKTSRVTYDGPNDDSGDIPSVSLNIVVT